VSALERSGFQRQRPDRRRCTSGEPAVKGDPCAVRRPGRRLLAGAVVREPPETRSVGPDQIQVVSAERDFRLPAVYQERPGLPGLERAPRTARTCKPGRDGLSGQGRTPRPSCKRLPKPRALGRLRLGT